jgi:hypothetical protein
MARNMNARRHVWTRWCRFALTALALVELGVPMRAARAADDATFLEYEAGNACPDKTEFMEQVRARTPRVRFVSDPKGARIFSVSVGVRDGDAFGRISARRGGEKGAPREITGKTCAEVVSALALVAALAIDPHAAMATAASGPAVASTAPAGSPAATPADGDKAVPSAEPARAPASAATPANTFQDLPVTRPSSRRAGAIGGGLRGGASTWPASEPVVFANLSASVVYEAASDAVWSPALRLSAGRGESLTVRPSFGAARFIRTTVALDLCPFKFALSPRVALRSCAGFEGGSLEAIGIGDASITHTDHTSLGWVALRETIWLQGDLGKGWTLEVEGGLSEPLRRDTFVFATPNVMITHIPAVEPLLAMGVGAHFW